MLYRRLFASATVATLAFIGCSSSSNGGAPSGDDGGGAGDASLDGTGDGNVRPDGGANGDAGDDGNSCAQITPPPFVPGDASACPPTEDGGTEGGIWSGSEGGAVTCYPHDTSSFSSSWHAPPAGKQAVCTQDLMNQYFDDCVGPSRSATTCATNWGSGGDGGIDATHATCAACIASSSTDATWGPVVFVGGVPHVSHAACIALEEPCNLDCAKATLALFECEVQACDADCAVTDSTSQSAYDTCHAVASNACGCKDYLQVVTGCQEQITGAGHPAEKACLLNSYAQGSTPQALYNSIVPLFCGM